MEIITVAELKSRMDAGEKLNIIDVREPDEFAEFNIGGILIPLGQKCNCLFVSRNYGVYQY